MGVGENVRRIRREKGLTLNQVAKVAKVTEATLSRVERGTKCLSLQSAKAVADALGCTLDDLLEGWEPAGD